MSQSKKSLIIRQLLFEKAELQEKLGGRAVAPGGADGMPDQMPMGYFDRHVATIGQDVPLDPTPQTAVQLSTEAPPVDDDSYVPSDAPNLALAVGVLAREANLDSSEVGMFYKTVKKMLDKYCAKKAGVIVQEALKPEDLASFYDPEGWKDDDLDDDELEALIRSIKDKAQKDVNSQAVTEATDSPFRGPDSFYAFDDDDDDDGNLGMDDDDDDPYAKITRQAAIDIEKVPAVRRDALKLKKAKTELEPLDIPDEPEAKKGSGDPYLQQVMAITGHSGESGARQWAHRATVLLGFLIVLDRNKGYRTILKQFYKDFSKAVEELDKKGELGPWTHMKDELVRDAELVSNLKEPINSQLAYLYRELFGKMFNKKFFGKMYSELKNALEDVFTTYPEAANLPIEGVIHLAKMAVGEVDQTPKNLAKAGLINKDALKAIEKKIKSKNPAEQLTGQLEYRKINDKLRTLMSKIGKVRNDFINMNVADVAFDIYDEGKIAQKMPGEIKKLTASVPKGIN